MNIVPAPQKTKTLLSLFGLCFVILGWLELALALFGLFYLPLVMTCVGLMAVIMLVILWKLLQRGSIYLRAVLVFTLLFSIFVTYTSVPTIFSGRDQGSIAEAAYRLAQNHQLAFSLPAAKTFFDIYGPGTALNFPGFAYTQTGDLITQFPVGYIAWLATFVALFGLTGFAIGNGLLLFLFFMMIFAFLRVSVHVYYAIIGVILAAMSFLPIWFSKMTLSENLAVFLFTFLVYNLYLYFEEAKPIYYASILLSAGLLCFTRVEGFAFLILAVGALFLHPGTKAIWKKYHWKGIALPIVVFGFLLMRDLFINLPYFKTIGKAFFKFVGVGDTVATATVGGGPLAIGSVFFLYGLLILFIIGIFSILLFVKERRYTLLIPAAIALPTLLYLFFPNITLDHPWFLRRFYFSVYPALLLSSVTGLALLFAKDKSIPFESHFGKRAFFVTMIFLALIVLQYPAWKLALSFQDNKTLIEQIGRVSQDFSSNDLILVDRFATGDPYTLPTGPGQFLYGKNFTYFFNPNDLAKIDTSKYDKVYLLTPQESVPRYAAAFGPRLTYMHNVDFSTDQLQNVAVGGQLLRLPQKTTVEASDILFEIK